MAKKAKSKVSVSEQIRQQAIEQEATKSKRKQHRQRQEKKWAIGLLLVCLLSAIGGVAKTGGLFSPQNTTYTGAEFSKGVSDPLAQRLARDSYLPPESAQQVAFDNARLDDSRLRTVATSNTSTNSTPNTVLFNGQQQDETGLYYLRARTYDPKTGRFLSHDPELGKSKEPTSLHRYVYASNDPVNRIDPSGRSDGSITSSLNTLSVATVLAGVTYVAMKPALDNLIPPYSTYPSNLTLPVYTNTDSGASRLPDLTGKTREQAEKELEDAGFIPHSTSAGGYERLKHPDGSEIYIRPNGEVIRLGPKVTGQGGKKYHPRVGPDGQPGSEHSTGETLSG